MKIKKDIKVGIIGGSGYTGEELLRILCSHDATDVIAISSRELNGKSTNELVKDSNLTFIDPEDNIFFESEVVFFSTPHGVSSKVAKDFIDKGIKVIDLSADFRLKDIKVWKKWYGSDHPQVELLSESIYGLTELNHSLIKEARLVAVPGCYPTASLLGILPFLQSDLKIESVVIDAKSGLSGAGRTTVTTKLEKEMLDNFMAYGVEGHRHLPEINEVAEIVYGSPIKLSFLPHLIPTMRGIYATSYINFKELRDMDFQDLFSTYYQHSPNIKVLQQGEVPEIRSVTLSNDCSISINRTNIPNQIVTISAIDNLLKGAAGQAVECYNLMTNSPQRMGLDNG